MREHNVFLLKEKGSEWFHGTRDIIHCTFTFAIVRCCRLELAFPCHSTVHTTCSRSCFKYLNFLYSSKIFLDECRPKIYPLRKKVNYNIIYSLTQTSNGNTSLWCTWLCVECTYIQSTVFAFHRSIMSSLTSFYPQCHSRDKVSDTISMKIGQVKLINYYKNEKTFKYEQRSRDAAAPKKS